MADGVPHAQSLDFSIGRVFSRAFGTIAANPLAALGIAFLFGALPSEAYYYASAGLLGRPSAPTALETGLILVAEGLIQMMAGMILSNIFCGAFVGLVVAQEEGRRPSFVDTSLAGLRALFPLLILSLITGVGTMLGFILLVVPGIFLSLMWTAAPAVLVAERCGVFAALGRSRRLAAGAWGEIFAVNILVGVATLAFGYLVGWVTTVLGGEADIVRIAQQPLPIMSLSVQFLTGTIATVFAAAVNTSIYVELRNWKHGTPDETLAEIFA